MEKAFILVILFVIIYLISLISTVYIYNKWVNRVINAFLFILLFILPDTISCIIFMLLVLRLINWLFGPAQDEIDLYYYTRYERAKRNYYKRRRR